MPIKFEHRPIQAAGGAASAQPPHDLHGAHARETIRALVAEILAAAGHNDAFGDDDTLAEIGIGSVDMVALLLAIESAFDFEVPQHEISIDVFRSVSTLDAMVRRLQPCAPPARDIGAPAPHVITRVLCDHAAV